MNKLPPGTRRHGAGYEASVKFRGERSYASFPIDATWTEITEWREDERAHLRGLLGDRPRAGTFEGDARIYLALPSVKAMPTFAERTQHITEWCQVFKGRRRRALKAHLIEAQRDRWLTTPRAIHEDGTVKTGPYSAAAVNKRLRALSNVWTRLDGRRAPNPVLEVDECEEPDPEARGLPYDIIETILAAIPETGVGVKKDKTRTTGKNIERPSLTKARLRVIAYTGIPHATLKKLTRASVTLFPVDADGKETGGSLLLPPRRKGKKRRRAQDKPLPELLPLIPQAAAAFRRFDALNCWGDFSNSSMWKAFRKACTTVAGDDDEMTATLKGISPYWFRHSFLSALYDETKDLRVTGKFGGHRSERTTRRYTMAAVAPHVAAAAERLRLRFALPPDPATRHQSDL